MLRSLRSRLIVGSVLWTAGLLALMHMLSIVFMHVFPGTLRIKLTWPILLGLVLIVAGVSVLLHGLSPFRRLRNRLAAVQAGQDRRVSGKYPTEVQPLVDDLNALLDDREKAVSRALATAGDLAHGLKTPLAVLAQEAERAAASGDSQLADGIAQQVELMRRQVDYHLARARAASGATSSARCLVVESAEGLVRTLLKLHAGRALDIRVNVPAELTVRAQREDMDEMLGNLIDNSCKWTKGRVVVDAVPIESEIILNIDDDGPGLAKELRTLVLQRGVRADEAAPGSGLGLAIVRDLAELYGGSISLEDSPLGGLRARLVLPSATYWSLPVALPPLPGGRGGAT
jgi:signal transduction histidine kinase